MKFYCTVCGCEIEREIKFKSIYLTCLSEKCREEAKRRKLADYHKKIKSGRINPIRRAGIEQMRKELDTREKFVIATYGHGGKKRVARQYGILDWDVTNYSKDLFAGMSKGEITRCRREICKQMEVEKGQDKQTEPLERKPVAVKVFKITDPEAFEKGGPGTYDGLEFDRIQYVSEVTLPFNFPVGGEESL
jgi:hypothetical protein